MAATNPFAAPTTDALATISTEHDQFIQGQVASILEPGEKIRWTAFLTKAPSLFFQILFAGLIMVFFIKYYLAAVTNKRIILMRTKNWWMRPQMKNLGTEEIRWESVRGVTVGGLANNRSINFEFNDGTKRTLRMGPWAKFVSGQSEFFKFLEKYDPAQL